MSVDPLISMAPSWSEQWLILPVLIPLVAGALSAAFGGVSRGSTRQLMTLASVLHTVVACVLFAQATDGAIRVLALSDWMAPFGIVMVLDRLSATMLLLTSAMALAGLVYANAGWSDRGRRFHAMWQFQVMGLSGAFLTGDLFNLFVFFEVLLAASYALLLHGQGRARIGSTLHFVVVNLVGSAIFLLALGLLYGVTGTLNTAHLSRVIATLQGQDVALAGMAGLLLFLVFVIKSGLVPFHFWVPASYGSAAAPVVVLIVAKIGAYVLLRVYPLLYGPALEGATATAPLANLVQPWLIAMALLTLVVGAAGSMASRSLRQLAAMMTLVSIGTLFIPLALGDEQSVAAALWYLIHSTLATGALFLVSEWVGTQRGSAYDLFVPGPALRYPFRTGAALLITLATAIGLPPASGFFGKIQVLSALANHPLGMWLWAAIILSSFALLVAGSRALSMLLWNTVADEPAGDTRRNLRPVPEHLVPPGTIRWRHHGAIGATVVVVLASLLLALFAGHVADTTTAIARQLADQEAYRAAVLGPAEETLQPLLRPSPAQGVRP